jgi:hypothetical protein
MPRPVAHLANLDLTQPVASAALSRHRQYEDDTAHAWLRRLITETARRL